ncbi:MAG: hypothetical protein KDE28_03265 [Anaerolineales bacterium]|nr:hypothetical protein [Anaerolineales bacterium]
MSRSQAVYTERIYWLGGSPCSGKSSVAALLAEQYGLALYACDDHFPAHQAEATAAGQPTLHQLGQMSWDEIWLRPVPELVARVIAIYREEFPLLMADLQALVGDRSVLVEGDGLLPALLASLAIEPKHTFYLVPTPAFQKTMYAQRPWVQGILDQCREPEQAFANWMARDVAYGRWLATEAANCGFPVRPVAGDLNIAATAAVVADAFQLAKPTT